MLNRRRFIQASGASIAASHWANPMAMAQGPRSQPPPRSKPATKKIAVVATTYYYLSHAYHICGRFLHGYLRDGQMHYPDHAIAGMFVEQQKAGDLSRPLAARHGFALYPDVAQALTLGTDKLAVDGVLLIGEHGDYPYNAKGQKLYPRFELFQQIAEVFRRSGRGVPVFCDKHLSYDRAKGRAMVETARELKFPLFAGSSLPVTWRRPELELPLGAPVEEALVASRGEIELFGFHALEALQCMVERRTRGQQGVHAVTCLEGDAVWRAGDAGLWSWELLEHALGRSPSLNVGSVRENCRHYVSRFASPANTKGPAAFLVEYRDGLKATVLILNGHVDDTTFAARVRGQAKPASTLFMLPPPPGADFLGALTSKVEEFLTTGRAPYPVERTMLTGGILDLALESRHQGHKRLETPDLDVSYAPPADSGFMRGGETHPT
ncbi:MAG: hypothetical protein JSS27_14225 [Planctomycetes bacterium]|nr:hypothetical protein [Planctomycetota bacterium]